jgi:AAA domain, putative AbiEii toxin, Type IV TA system/AAA domain
VRVSSLHVSNLLSFDSFELSFDDGLNVVVGPNGSGKTNVVRVLDLVSKLLAWADERTRAVVAAPTPAGAVVNSYVQAVHDKAPPGTPIEIRLGIKMTTSAERERIVAFVRAAVLSTLTEESRALDEHRKSLLSTWVEAQIDENTVSPLFEGTLAFRHSGHEGGSWDARFEFEHDDNTYDWILFSSSSWDSVILHDTAINSTVAATQLWEALFGQSTNANPPPEVPDPLPNFAISALCLSGGKRLANVVVRIGAGTFSDQYETYRKAASLLRFPPSDSAGQTAYGLARAMSLCMSDGLVVFGEQFRGLGIGGTLPWRAGIYPWESLVGPVPLRDPGFLPLRLFQLKNSPHAEDRTKFAAIQEQFEHLSQGRLFDVTFTATTTPVSTPAPIGAGQVAIPGGGEEASDDGSAGSVVTVVAWSKSGSDPRSERPIQLFGAGTWETLVLAEALIGSPERVTVLDEPAVTLHPTWQAALRNELRNVDGQLLLVTHSPSLVPIDTGDDIRRLVRLSNENGSSRIHRLPSGPTTTDLAKMTRLLSLSTDARALLFARGAVVVSGETELGALPIWWSKATSAAELGTPSQLDLSFYSVAGDGGFTPLLSVLAAFDIPWVLLCDGKSFDIEKNWGSHVFRQVQRAGIKIQPLEDFLASSNECGKTQRKMTTDLWNRQIALAAQHRIFTLGTGWDDGTEESVEGFFERAVPGKLAEAEAEVGRSSKVRKGRWIAHETSCPVLADELYRKVVAELITQPSEG